MFLNTPFSKEYRVLIKNLYLLKGYTAQKLLKEFSGKELDCTKTSEAAN